MYLTRKENVSLAILLCLFVWVFYPVWVSLVSAWSASEDYSHGFLILPLSVYILWGKREQLLELEVNPTWSALPLALLGLCAYLLARYAEISTVSSLAMIAVLASGVLMLFGWRIFLLCLFPLSLLLFMVPVPAQIYASLTVPLQLFVTKVTTVFLVQVGVPLLREGNVLHLPEHTLEVVQACSGLRSIMSLLTLGAVIAYFGLSSYLLRGLLFVSAIPVAIFVNIVRVFIMVVALYYFNVDLIDGPAHVAFGAGIFVLSILLFLLLRKGLALCER